MPCTGTRGQGDCLDYENNDDHAYHFTVIAADAFSEGLVATVPVTVNILNENDSPPKFTQLEYISYIVEGSTIPNPQVTVQVSTFFLLYLLDHQSKIVILSKEKGTLCQTCFVKILNTET